LLLIRQMEHSNTQSVCIHFPFQNMSVQFGPLAFHNLKDSSFEVVYIILQGAAKVSILMIGQQAIMDAYLCLLHLTAGILVGESFES
jgi:hypothetical protein